MMLPSPRRRDSLLPALLAALVLHVVVFLLATYAGRPPMGPLGSAVPINIVSSAPVTNSRPAEAAPETQSARTETPVPEAKPATPPPAPPAPAPPTPKAPSAKPVPVKPTPAPPIKAVAKPAPNQTQSRDTFSLDALAAKISRTAKPSPSRPASGAKGPAQAETAPEARIDAGSGVSQSDIAGLSGLLERLWNPNCETAGGSGVVIPVKFTVGYDGHVLGRVTEGGRDASTNLVVSTAARRAIDAVHQAEPYAATYRGQTFTVIFDAKKACANH
jgi:outer membrane biosynthesis protein TonB